MKTLLASFAAFLVVAGCASTQEAAQTLSRNFAGKNIDAFVLQYGAPYQRHQLNSGDLVYMWSSEIRSYGLPTTTTIQGTRFPYGFSGTATNTNASCDVT
jgi:hypothetical protein